MMRNRFDRCARALTTTRTKRGTIPGRFDRCAGAQTTTRSKRA